MAEPARIPTSEVLRLAGYRSVTTLNKRIAQGRMPRPVDRGRENLFDRHAVYCALGLDDNSGGQDDDPWAAAVERLRGTGDHQPAEICHPPASRRA